MYLADNTSCDTCGQFSSALLQLIRKIWRKGLSSRFDYSNIYMCRGVRLIRLVQTTHYRLHTVFEMWEHKK